MKHLPPHRQVISWFVTLPQVQHHSDSKRAKKSGFFSNEGTKTGVLFESVKQETRPKLSLSLFRALVTQTIAAATVMGHRKSRGHIER